MFFGLLAIEAIEFDRCWLPAIWGTCALMCSAIGVPMVAAGGIVALARSKPKLAVAAVVPPAVIFVIWYLAIGHNGTTASADVSSLSLSGLASYVWVGLAASLGGYLRASQYVGGVLLVVLIGTAAFRRNVPAALAFSTLVLYVFVGSGRLNEGTAEAASARYSYVAIALLLPLIGQVVTRFVHSHELRPIVMTGLVVVVVINVVFLRTYEVAYQAFLGQYDDRNQIEAAAYLIHKGERFPGEFPAASRCPTIVCVRQDDPKLSQLTTWIRRGQFPAPSDFPAHAVHAERTVLGVFTSTERGYRNDLTFGAGTISCSTTRPSRAVIVHVPTSGSLRVKSAFRHSVPIMTVVFYPVADAPGTSIDLPLFSADKWLNIPSGTYPTAVVSASSPVRVCEGSTG